MNELLDALSNKMVVKFFTLEVGSHSEIEIIMIDELDDDLKTIRRRCDFSVDSLKMNVKEMHVRLIEERKSGF